MIDNITVIEAHKRLLDKVKRYNPQANLVKITKACDMGNKAHESQLRISGKPYMLHPIAVAEILAELRLDTTSIIAALLHDTVEDTNLTIDEIEKAFGKEVAKIVDGVTKFGKINKSDFSNQAENFRKLLLALSKDIRVLLIKLADRLHNMQTLSYFKSTKKRLRIAHETMEIYSPLAERIGVHKLKNELQDLAFAELYPEVRKSIKNRLDFLRKADINTIDNTIKEIKKTINDEVIESEVYGREKTLCSIWYKMRNKQMGFEQLSDIIAFRILVNTMSDCYRVLGAIHSKYHMIPGGFKDYISTPKVNGYKSLHTLVMGPNQKTIEIQIRTYDMHNIAEFGVAAHWEYKQKSRYKKQGSEFKWIREILEILNNTSNPEEFLENTKLEMHYDQVFCFTPKGKLIALPSSATPLDFAFTVHSTLGLHCMGAKVNGKIVPLKTKLENGDKVEILNASTPVVSPNWESIAVTGKAKSEIKKFIRSKKRREFMLLGKHLLEQELKKVNIKLNNYDISGSLEHFQYASIEDLYFAIGEGKINPADIIKFTYPNIKISKTSRINILGFGRKKAAFFNKNNSLPIKGLTPGMAIHFASCCQPLPGNKILGFIKTGKGVIIHTIDCETLEGKVSNTSKFVDVVWEDNSDQVYTGRINITVSNELGSLGKVINQIVEEKLNISDIKIIARSVNFFELLIDIDIKELQQLNRLIKSLATFKNVYSVKREKC